MAHRLRLISEYAVFIKHPNLHIGNIMIGVVTRAPWILGEATILIVPLRLSDYCTAGDIVLCEHIY